MIMNEENQNLSISGVATKVNPANTEKRLDPRIIRILNAANDLRGGGSENIGYYNSILCQTHLPVKTMPLDVRTWESKNGFVSIRIEAGYAYDEENDIWVKLGLPSGTKARLALIHLCTQAILEQSPEIMVSNTLNEFLATLLSRKPNGNEIRELKTQLSALSAATIRLATSGQQRNTSFVKQFNLDWTKKGKKKLLWPKYFTLSDEFWDELKNRAVPVDMKAVSAISHSALQLDIYMWLTHRLTRIDEPYTVFWSLLHKQFGAGYRRPVDFRRKFLIALRAVCAVYPNARVSEEDTIFGEPKGIRLYPSPPPISKLTAK